MQDADSKDERPIHERIDLPSIAACGGCHQDVYRQWSSSLHHGAWSNANVQTATKRFTRETCRPCHSRATATLNLPPQLATAVTGLRFTFTALGIDGSGNLFATPPAELLVAP